MGVSCQVFLRFRRFSAYPDTALYGMDDGDPTHTTERLIPSVRFFRVEEVERVGW